MAKPKLATTWLAGCSGCHIALVDLEEGLLDLAGQVELTACPPLTDIKEAPEVDIALVEGAVGTHDNVEVLQKLRARAGKLIALGSCACYGGIPGLRNFHTSEQVLDRAYGQTESNDDGGAHPTGKAIPALEPFVRPIDQVVKVDGYIPGCPPTGKMLRDGLAALLDGKSPQVSARSLCGECPRKHSVMRTTRLEFVSNDAVALCELERIDPDLCFIEQGVPCLGLATRLGCEARCPKANVPCRGCMGPTPQALEQGAKWLNAIGSLLPAGALSLMDDVAGLGNRFTLATSLCPHVRDDGGKP